MEGFPVTVIVTVIVSVVPLWEDDRVAPLLLSCHVRVASHAVSYRA